MRFIETDFPGLFILEPKVFKDERGFFFESHSDRVFAENGLEVDFIQDNHAYSRDKGVLRGFHLQLPPAAQAKLVRVTRGAVLDAAMDLRRGSPTYGRVFEMELTADNHLQLFIPKGFAHAYLTLEPHTEFLYKVDAPYAPETEAGIIWNDPSSGFRWPIDNPLLSPKDMTLPLFEEFESPFVSEQ